MARIVHCRRVPVGMRFREWSAESGTYVTAEMAQVPMRNHLLATDLDVDAADTMLRRALISGTSEAGAAFKQDGDWQADKKPGPVAAEASPPVVGKA